MDVQAVTREEEIAQKLKVSDRDIGRGVWKLGDLLDDRQTLLDEVARLRKALEEIAEGVIPDTPETYRFRAHLALRGEGDYERRA